MIKQIKDNDLSVISKKDTAIVFSASWCNSCHDLIRRLEPFSEVLNDKIYNADVDENEDLATKYNIKTLPCVIIFKNGVARDRYDNNFRFQDLFDKIRSL